MRFLHFEYGWPCTLPHAKHARFRPNGCPSLLFADEFAAGRFLRRFICFPGPIPRLSYLHPHPTSTDLIYL